MSEAVKIPQALIHTDFAWLGERYEGKVRDSYRRGARRVLIATDRLSAFDRIVSSVPGKGQVLTMMARYWFEKTAAIATNHLEAVPDPCVMVGREVSILPIEVIVRGFLAGSAWRDYSAGRDISGVRLPAGLREFDQLAEPIVTPCTKAPMGEHDQPLSERELIRRGLVSEALWDEARETALRLFNFGAREVRGRGLLFADTKYEFGVLDGKLVIADEMHTLDSSRFWVERSYDERRSRGEPPEMLDKEPIRRWLMDRGFSGEGDIPLVDDNYRLELRKHYAKSAELITGESFTFDDSEPLARIEGNLKGYFAELE
jgi:phosphoribosylaminoimidazole-succinocarboxamide synthase